MCTSKRNDRLLTQRVLKNRREEREKTSRRSKLIVRYFWDLMNRMLKSTHRRVFHVSWLGLIIGCSTNEHHRDERFDTSISAQIQPDRFVQPSATVGSLSTATHARPSNLPTSFEVQRPSSPSPPPGWEAPPPPPVRKNSEKNPEDAPACCGFDRLCCARQSEIDRGIRVPARKNFSVSFANVPEATIAERAKDGPPIAWTSDLRVVDGTGAPFPWINGPQQWEIRLIPKAKFGYIRFGGSFSGIHFDDPQYRSLGHGVTIPLNPTPDKGRSLLKGAIEYWTFNPGQGDQIIHDHLKGQMNGSPEIVAERWVHVAAVNAAEGIVHAYRAIYDGQPYVFFVLPEVIIGFESPKATTFGGTGNDRFATDFPYTLYRFPLGAGHSDTINCIVQEHEIRRWFPRAKDAMKLPDELPIIISMSQTSAETEPRIRIMFL